MREGFPALSCTKDRSDHRKAPGSVSHGGVGEVCKCADRSKVVQMLKDGFATIWYTKDRQPLHLDSAQRSETLLALQSAEKRRLRASYD